MSKLRPHPQRVRGKAAVPPPGRSTRRLQDRKSKISRVWKSTATHHAPGYWDSLSKIRLTRRSIREFNRRNAIQLEKTNNQTASIQDEYFPGDIKRFSRHADYSELRGYPEPQPSVITSKKSKRRSTSTTCRQQRDSTLSSSAEEAESNDMSKKSGRSSAYDSDFMGHLVSRHIDLPMPDTAPDNFDTICTRLKQRRRSLSPSRFTESHFSNFLLATRNARNEAQVMSQVLPKINGDKIYPSSESRLCNNWIPITDSTLVIPKPDYYDGLRQSPEDLELREALSKLIVPSTSSDAPFLPNFIVEAKGPGGSGEIAEHQAVYDGAFAARGMHHLQIYGKEDFYDNKAYALTATYCRGIVEIFAHYMTSLDSCINPLYHSYYHTTALGTWALKHSADSFRDGVTAFRNARDLAYELREEVITAAIRRMQLFSPVERTHWKAVALQRAEKAEKAMQPPTSSEGSSEDGVSQNPTSEHNTGDETDATITPARQARRKKGLTKKPKRLQRNVSFSEKAGQHVEPRKMKARRSTKRGK